MANPTEVTTPTDFEVKVVREFNAPRELVFRAWTDPNLVFSPLDERRRGLAGNQVGRRPPRRRHLPH